MCLEIKQIWQLAVLAFGLFRLGRTKGVFLTFEKIAGFPTLYSSTFLRSQWNNMKNC
jgi:hypothetical protein